MISKNCAGVMKWGTTSASNINLRKHTMGSLFSRTLISSHINSSPKLQFSGMQISKTYWNSLSYQCMPAMISLLNIFLMDSSSFILWSSFSVLMIFSQNTVSQGLLCPGYNFFAISLSSLMNFFLLNFCSSTSRPFLLYPWSWSRFFPLISSQRSTNCMILLEFLMNSFSMMRERNQTSIKFLGYSLQMVEQMSSMFSSLKEERCVIFCYLDSCSISLDWDRVMGIRLFYLYYGNGKSKLQMKGERLFPILDWGRKYVLPGSCHFLCMSDQQIDMTPLQSLPHFALPIKVFIAYKMFEIQQRHTGRFSNASKNHSSSRSKIPKKQPLLFKQKLAPDILSTECAFKQKKSKSQCIPKHPNGERKSLDICKFIQTTRSTGRGKKSREKTEKIARPFEQIYTEDRARHQSYLISNLTTQKSAQLKWAKKGIIKKVTEGRSTQKKRVLWNEKNIPYDWSYTLEHYSHYLTKYQQSQIKQYKKIYCIGHKANKREKIDHTSFDNEEKEYRYLENDHIAYRYEILALIGKGSYGQVFRALDHKTKEEIALKIIKNEQKFSKQAFVEIKILSQIKEADEDHKENIVRIKDFVVFRKHVCIIFELLSDNLYELIVRNNYNGLNEQLIRRFAIQILVSLQFLRRQGIIHCDLKPQNILLKQYNKSGIKMIDFGSSCFQNETVYTYIQSRYYRAPQITLGIPYNHFIDTWSTGCILAELYTGVPVFPGENEFQQMKYMVDTLGMPPKGMIKRGSRRSVFFDEEYFLNASVKSTSSSLQVFSKPLRERIQDKDFLDFIESFLKWSPQQRISPRSALSHPWIKKGLPQQLKNQLSASHKLLKKQCGKSSKRMKTKSKQKGSSTVKLSTKASQQRLKKSYGLKL